MGRVFATAIDCIDGGAQIPVIEYIKSEHGVDFVDVVTEPGPDKILADNKNRTTIESIRHRIID